MIVIWTVDRFLHVLGAIIRVDGQLTVTLVLPPAHRALTPTDRADVLRAVGKRFAVITTTVFLSVQITTGILLAGRHGVTWASLLHPGYGRILAAKLLLFVVVMAATAVHGVDQAGPRPRAARGAAGSQSAAPSGGFVGALREIARPGRRMRPAGP